MKSGLTVGIIGCGQVVENVHLPLLLAMGCNIAWLYDRSDARVRYLSTIFKLPEGFNGLKLHELPDPSVCLIACPYGVRQEYYKWLRQKSCALFIEKPIALTVAEHLLINGLRRDYEIGVGFNRRASGIVQLLVEAVTGRYFGRVREVHFEFGGMIVTTGGRYNDNVTLAGGGALFETGVHYIDTINYVLGAVNVQDGDAEILFDEDNLEVHAQGRYTLETHNHSNVNISFIFSYLQSTENALVMRFDSGEVRCSLFSNDLPEVRSFTTGRALKIVDCSERTLPNTSYATNYLLWKTFLDGLDKKCITFVSSASSLITTKVIEQIYRSSGRSL